MKKVVELVCGLRRDEDGASLVEYTMLLAIIVLAVITTLGGVGRWVNNTWSGFFTALIGPDPVTGRGLARALHRRPISAGEAIPRSAISAREGRDFQWPILCVPLHVC